MHQIPISIAFISSCGSSRHPPPQLVTLSSIFWCCCLNRGPGGNLSRFRGPAQRPPFPWSPPSPSHRESQQFLCLVFSLGVLCFISRCTGHAYRGLESVPGPADGQALVLIFWVLFLSHPTRTHSRRAGGRDSVYRHRQGFSG